MFLLMLLAAVVGSSGHSLLAADAYVGSSVLPKCERLVVSIDQVQVATEADFQWPAVVGKVEGQWLWITDDGRSRADGRPSQGWVRKSDVILTEKDPIESLYPTAIDYFTAQLAMIDSHLPNISKSRAYWLRGVAWETVPDYNAARDDYRCAIECPDIHGSSYEDEVHAGRARCLAALTIRNNASVFASSDGICQLWKACCRSAPSCSTLEFIPLPVPTPASPLLVTFLPLRPSRESPTRTRVSPPVVEEAAREIQSANRDFLTALTYCQRPRTFADWADALMVINSKDVPNFGYYILPAYLSDSTGDRRSEQSEITSASLANSGTIECSILKSTMDVLRCQCICPPPASMSCSKLSCDITVPMLCNMALSRCRVLEHAYITRGRYYQEEAARAMQAHIARVSAWRAAQMEAADKDRKRTAATSKSADDGKSKLTRLKNYQQQLAQQLQALDELRKVEPKAAKDLRDTLVKDVAASLTAIHAQARVMKESQSPAEATGFVSALADELRSAEQLCLIRDRARVKSDLRELQAASMSSFDCPPNVDEYVTRNQDRPVLTESIRFYYYWRLAIRDAQEAVSIVSKGSSYAPTAYRLKAEILLMRLDPTGLQSIEATPQCESHPICKLTDQLLKTIDAFERAFRQRWLVDPEEDMQTALQAADAAEQGVKLSDYKGQYSLTTWAAALADTGEYAAAIRRQKSALEDLNLDQRRIATYLLLKYCAAKKIDPDEASKCPDVEAAVSSESSSDDCKPCLGDSGGRSGKR
ncbi:MAG: hypothetical protein C5B59_03975 [Bacteroidetes bacterium]|nr:MAG: hypothetical protein C5B59_03975 [Bacteroidota bacterium]